MTPAKELEELTLKDYFGIIQKRKFALINFVALCVIAATVYSIKAPEIYEGTTRLLIERNSPKAVSMEQIFSLETSELDYYKTQHELLQSRSLAKNVITALGLEDSDELKPDVPLVDLSFITNGFNSFISYFKEKNVPTGGDGLGIEEDPYSVLINRFLRKVRIDPVKNSRLVDIKFQGHSPAAVALISNTIGKMYILKNVELRSSVEEDTGKFLKERINELKKKMRRSELALQEYREKNNSVEVEEKRDIATQKLAELSSEVTKAKTERVRLETLIEQLNKMEGDPIEKLSTLPHSIKNDVLVQLHKDYFEVQREFDESTKKFGKKHPALINLANNLKIIKERFPKELRRVIKSVEVDYQAAFSHERSMERALRAQKKAVMHLDRISLKYNSLKREVEADQNLFQILIDRMKSADVSSRYNESNIRIVDSAEVPSSPIFPQTGRNIALAFAFGVVGGALLIFFLESLDTTIRTVEDVEKHVPYPLLGAVSIFDKKEGELPVVNDVPSQRAEEFRIIRTNVLFTSPDNPKKVLMITSAVPGEGKSTIVSNLAVVFARMGKNVLILDADLRRSRIHSIFGVKGQPGLTEVLFGQKDLKDVIQKTKINGVSVIPRGSVTRGLSPYSSEYLSSKKFKGLLNSLRESFDFIFVDVPPILNIADASVVAKYCDGIIFTLKSGFSDIKVINRAIKQLSASTPGKNVGAIPEKGEEKGLSLFPKNTTEVLGAIFNMVDYRKEGMGSYNKYYRGYYFDKKGRDISERKAMSA